MPKCSLFARANILDLDQLHTHALKTSSAYAHVHTPRDCDSATCQDSKVIWFSCHDHRNITHSRRIVHSRCSCTTHACLRNTLNHGFVRSVASPANMLCRQVTHQAGHQRVVQEARSQTELRLAYPRSAARSPGQQIQQVAAVGARRNRDVCFTLSAYPGTTS